MEHTQRPPMPSENPAASTAAVASAHGKVLRPTPDLAEAMNRGYEPRDINLRGLFIFLGVLVASLVVVLAAIYAIMMALVEYDRSRDPLGTPVSITRPDMYAPLQPSIGHPTEDTDDMLAMREQTQATLLNPTLARQMPIGQAMDVVLAKLVISPHPVAQPAEPTYPPGSQEGRFTGSGGDRPTAE
jgi:hypothetical protein